jgi:hypothetical protein
MTLSLETTLTWDRHARDMIRKSACCLPLKALLPLTLHSLSMRQNWLMVIQTYRIGLTKSAMVTTTSMLMALKLMVLSARAHPTECIRG